MNICILASAYHPAVGGAETYARTIAESMSERGHNVLVITDCVGTDLPENDIINGVEVLRTHTYEKYMHDPTKVRWQQVYFGILTELEALLRERKIDLIHANNLETAIFGSMISKSLNIPIVCTYHEQIPEKEAYGKGKCEFVFGHTPVDLFIAGSKFYRDKALMHDGDSKKIKVVYHGIDLNKFKEDNLQLRKSLNVGPEDFLIVTVARLKERKGLYELIQAVNILKDKIPNLKVQIAGSCNSASRDYADLLYGTIDQLGLKDIVKIDETLTLDKIPDLQAAADIIVQPSFEEGLGYAVLEGLASKKPVVSTMATGIIEIITHNENGLLVPVKDVVSLADAIFTLKNDEDLQHRLVENGYNLVHDQFNLKRMINETETIYLDLVAKRSKTLVETI